MNRYTVEIKDYLKNNHKGKSIIELSKEINEKFGLNTTPDNIQNLKSKIRIREGFVFEPARNDGCIKKDIFLKIRGKSGTNICLKNHRLKL